MLNIARKLNLKWKYVITHRINFINKTIVRNYQRKTIVRKYQRKVKGNTFSPQ